MIWSLPLSCAGALPALRNPAGCLEHSGAFAPAPGAQRALAHTSVRTTPACNGTVWSPSEKRAVGPASPPPFAAVRPTAKNSRAMRGKARRAFSPALSAVFHEMVRFFFIRRRTPQRVRAVSPLPPRAPFVAGPSRLATWMRRPRGQTRSGCFDCSNSNLPCKAISPRSRSACISSSNGSLSSNPSSISRSMPTSRSRTQAAASITGRRALRIIFTGLPASIGPKMRRA